jgi:hypothetical protein
LVPILLRRSRNESKVIIISICRTLFSSIFLLQLDTTKLPSSLLTKYLQLTFVKQRTFITSETAKNKSAEIDLIGNNVRSDWKRVFRNVQIKFRTLNWKSGRMWTLPLLFPYPSFKQPPFLFCPWATSPKTSPPLVHHLPVSVTKPLFRNILYFFLYSKHILCIWSLLLIFFLFWIQLSLLANYWWFTIKNIFKI